MPLVTPDTQPPSAEEVKTMSVEDKKSALEKELAGKTVTEESTSETNIHKKELMEKYGSLRVVNHNGMMTRDFRPGRINVHLDENNMFAKFSDN